MPRKKNKDIEEKVNEEPKEEITFSEVADANLTSLNLPKSIKEKAKDLLNKFIKEETRLVKGKFRNYEIPGGSQHVFVVKYPGIPPFSQVLEDGGTYEIPLYVARHINGVDVTAKQLSGKVNSCAYPTHCFKWDNATNAPQCRDEGGIIVPLVVPSKWTKRYGFESLEFQEAM
jgi:hypothetical protein